MEEEIEFSPSLHEVVADLPLVTCFSDLRKIIKFIHFAVEKVILVTANTEDVTLDEVIFSSIDLIPIIKIISGSFLDDLEILDIDKAVVGLLSKDAD